VDVYWLAAVLSILVMGGTVLSVSMRFLKRNSTNPWLFIALGIIGIPPAIVAAASGPYPGWPQWFAPVIAVLVAVMAGFLIGSGVWLFLLKDWTKPAGEQSSRLKDRGRGPDHWG
jgi:hypothetical protein